MAPNAGHGNPQKWPVLSSPAMHASSAALAMAVMPLAGDTPLKTGCSRKPVYTRRVGQVAVRAWVICLGVDACHRPRLVDCLWGATVTAPNAIRGGVRWVGRAPPYVRCMQQYTVHAAEHGVYGSQNPSNGDLLGHTLLATRILHPAFSASRMWCTNDASPKDTTRPMERSSDIIALMMSDTARSGKSNCTPCLKNFCWHMWMAQLMPQTNAPDACMGVFTEPVPG